jgi:hypothetical protein
VQETGRFDRQRSGRLFVPDPGQASACKVQEDQYRKHVIPVRNLAEIFYKSDFCINRYEKGMNRS